MIRKLSESN